MLTGGEGATTLRHESPERTDSYRSCPVRDRQGSRLTAAMCEHALSGRP